MSAAGILGYGVYVPPFRIARAEIARAWGGSGGRGEVSVAGYDEDVVTMGVEAAENALRHAGVKAAGAAALYLATTSAPYLEQSSANLVCDVLGFDPGAERLDMTASPRAGVAALKLALAHASAEGPPEVVVAGERRAPASGSDLEPVFGAAAACCVVGVGDCIAEVEATTSETTQVLDRWRGERDRHTRSYDSRFAGETGYATVVTSVARRVLEQLERTPDDYAHVVFQEFDGRVTRRVAGRLGVRPEQVEVGRLFDRVGDAGCGSPLLGLAAVLDRAEPGDRILLLAYGSGTADAISLVVTPAIAARRELVAPVARYLEKAEQLDYLLYARQVGALLQAGEPVEMGVPAASPLFWRGNEELRRLVGARCAGCGYVNYPPSLRKICIRCGSTELEKVALSRRGRVHTYGVNYYMPPPFQSPLPMIVADLDDGSRFVAHGTEMDPRELAVGMEVELVLRVLANERGATVYAHKFRPAAGPRSEVA